MFLLFVAVMRKNGAQIVIVADVNTLLVPVCGFQFFQSASVTIPESLQETFGAFAISLMFAVQAAASPVLIGGFAR